MVFKGLLRKFREFRGDKTPEELAQETAEVEERRNLAWQYGFRMHQALIRSVRENPDGLQVYNHTMGTKIRIDAGFPDADLQERCASPDYREQGFQVFIEPENKGMGILIGYGGTYHPWHEGGLCRKPLDYNKLEAYPFCEGGLQEVIRVLSAQARNLRREQVIRLDEGNTPLVITIKMVE